MDFNQYNSFLQNSELHNDSLDGGQSKHYKQGMVASPKSGIPSMALSPHDVSLSIFNSDRKFTKAKLPMRLLHFKGTAKEIINHHRICNSTIEHTPSYNLSPAE